jgi:3',5'-cyclic AMP phosphodiesterase CpdA
MTRVLQISDTHLSPAKQHFAGNWSPLRDWVLQQNPDLVIHTGDLTVDGADQEADMRACAELLGSLGGDVLAVPGNHDVGEAGHRHQPVNAERLARWRRHLGHDWWSRDVENWRLIGFNSMLIGSGGDEEARQFDWLRNTTSTAGGRRIAWFTHRPMFIDSPDEGDRGYWSIKPEPRERLLDLVSRHSVALIATGHLHKWHDRESAGCRFVWGPSSGFLVGPDNQPDLPGEKRLGAVIYEFEGAEVSVTPADVPGLKTLWIDDVLHEVYPPRHVG